MLFVLLTGCHNYHCNLNQISLNVIMSFSVDPAFWLQSFPVNKVVTCADRASSAWGTLCFQVVSKGAFYQTNLSGIVWGQVRVDLIHQHWTREWWVKRSSLLLSLSLMGWVKGAWAWWPSVWSLWPSKGGAFSHAFDTESSGTHLIWA